MTEGGGKASDKRKDNVGRWLSGRRKGDGNESSRERSAQTMIERRVNDRRVGDRRASERRRLRAAKPRTLTLATRLTMEFVLVAVATTVISLGLLAISWEQRFQQYSNEEMESIAQGTAGILAKRYEEIGSWSSATTEILPHIGELYESFGIEVANVNGSIVYSDLSFDSDGSTVATMPMGSRYELPIMVNGVRVGKVTVFVLPNIALTRGDQEFKANTFIAIFIAGIIATTLAALIGVFLARAFMRPLTYITSISNKVSSGDLSARTAMKGSDEFSRLGRSVDGMIAAIEKNKNLERQLTADVAHELRTPLAAMQATIEAMMDGVLPPDTIRLATLNSEVIRLGHLVDVLLELSRLESGKTTIKMGVVDLGDLIEELVRSHEMLITDAGLTIACELDPGALVRGDAELLRQAVANLLSNAVRYTSEGGHITLQVSVRQSRVQVFVSDTGMGIAAEDIPHVFSRFWRAAASRDRESGGLGIGLAMVNEIMAKHRGSVNVESELGVGSTFTLSFPLLK